MTSTPELLPVTQEDREEAWPFIPSNSIAGQDPDGFFAGKYDECSAPQAFARHRLNTRPATSTPMANLHGVTINDTSEAILSPAPMEADGLAACPPGLFAAIMAAKQHGYDLRIGLDKIEEYAAVLKSNPNSQAPDGVAG